MSNTQICCPKFNVAKWDNVTHEWQNKPFIYESIPQLFHIPFPPMIGWKITKMWNIAERAMATLPNKSETLILFYDPHAFKSEIYLSVTCHIPGANNVTISGRFFSKVFDGAYNAIPQFINEMHEYLKSQKLVAKKYYVHYAYCPKCSKKYGNNYIILFAEV